MIFVGGRQIYLKLEKTFPSHGKYHQHTRKYSTPNHIHENVS